VPRRTVGVRKTRDGRWQYSITHRGIRHRFRVPTRELAVAARQKALVAIAEGRHLDIDRTPSISFAEAVNRFLEWSAANRSASTLSNDKTFAREWLQLIPPTLPLRSVTGGDVEGVKTALTMRRRRSWTRRDKEPQTLSKRRVDMSLGRLKRLFSLCEKWGLITRDPAKAVSLFHQDHARERVLTPAEEEALLAATTGTFRTLVALAIQTGMRRGEILNLEWGEVDLAARRISIPARKTKSRRDRNIPLTARAVSLLESLPRSSAWVFGTGEGGPMKGFEGKWARAMRDTGIRGLRFHDLRHTFASRAAMAGVSLQALKEMLGHSTLQMVLRYAHLSPDHLAEEVRKMDERGAETAGVGHEIGTLAPESPSETPVDKVENTPPETPLNPSVDGALGGLYNALGPPRAERCWSGRTGLPAKQLSGL